MAAFRSRPVDKFKADLNKIAELFGTTVGVARRRIALQVWTGVVRMSPVLTGRFHGSWHLTEGSLDTSVLPPAPNGTLNFYSRPSLPSLPKPDSFQVSWITNNLPYAVPLEEGHSGKAPQGMVRVTLASVEARLRVEMQAAIQDVFGK